MTTLVIVSMVLNIILVAAIYFMFFTDKYSDKDFVIMNQQVRINQLEYELSTLKTDTYLDEIISQ